MSKRIIHLRNFNYGRIYPRLRKAINWIHSHRRYIRTKYINNHEYIVDFDYPYYWDMPKNLIKYLNSDEVDFIQEETYEWVNKIKEKLCH
jgi:hypothetical protein